MFDLKFVSCLPEAEKNMTFMTLKVPSCRFSGYVAVTFLAKSVYVMVFQSSFPLSCVLKCFALQLV